VDRIDRSEEADEVEKETGVCHGREDGESRQNRESRPDEEG
jgi:hypothetical protein